MNMHVAYCEAGLQSRYIAGPTAYAQVQIYLMFVCVCVCVCVCYCQLL